MRECNLPAFMQPGRLEAGCDEAGRGPLAGPVFAAAVILPEDFHHPLLNDSKKMSEHSRELLRPIIEKEAISWAVEEVSAEEIDELNILWASITGMQRAICKLNPRPEFLLIDGNRFRKFSSLSLGGTTGGTSYEIYNQIPYETVVHGDATFASIAAASVIAKTYRDAKMRALAQQYPQYGWDRNMGYPTPEHIEAIRQYGFTPFHRHSFHPAALEPTLF